MQSCFRDNFNYISEIMILSNHPYSYMNYEAIFSDETENFVSPVYPKSGDTLTIKIRVGKDDADFVFLRCGEKRISMDKIYSENLFDFYSCEFNYDNNNPKKICYHFEIERDNKVYFYNKRGIFDNIDSRYDFTIIYDFDIPEWIKGAVMYQIYVDRFYNGDTSNDVVNNEYAYLGKAAKKIEDWNRPVANEDICNFYGGDLQGVIDKMKYLKNLGVDVIYFNPIFVSPSNHKYDIQDYDYVDPHYGVIVKDGGEQLFFENFHNKYATMYMQRTTDKENLEASNRLMIKLIKIAHSNGIKIILDGVFNHCGAFNKWLDREGFYKGKDYPVGAYASEDSIYHNYFKWYDKNWPNNDCYDSWWGHDNHPKLNYENSPELYQYILNVGKKWVSPPFNADGWRLDVAADLGCSKEFNHKFWKDFRNAVKEANPNAVIFAEHYGDASDWLKGDQWDSVMNYDAFMEPISWFLTGMEKHSERYDEGLYCNSFAFEQAMRYNMSKFSMQSISMSMNELSNHDHSRFLTRTNKKVGRLHTLGFKEADTGINFGIMKEAVTFQMTWIGSPTIYYGDEAGLTGWTDPDNRRTYPWGRENTELLNFHKAIIKIHKKLPVLKEGSTDYLVLEYGVLSYARWNNNEKVIVILNNNKENKKISIPVWKIDIKNEDTIKRLIYSNENSFSVESKNYKVNNGYLYIEVEPYSSIILKKN